MTSSMAPRVHRTSLVSASGGYWKCRPRSVPFLRLREMLAWATEAFRPCSANSRAQNVRAKKPRSSDRSSRSITNAPFRAVSLNINEAPGQPRHCRGGTPIDPLEPVVQQAGRLQLIEHVKPDERRHPYIRRGVANGFQAAA